MKDSIKYLTLVNIAFVAILLLSGQFTGFIGQLIRYFAFLMPVLIAVMLSQGLKEKRDIEIGYVTKEPNLFSLKGIRADLFIPLIFPSVLIIFSTALLTSVLLTSLGFSSPASEKLPIASMILLHALVPAVLEELLFRFVPMKLLAPYSPRVCIFLSAIFFAVIHTSLFSIPYAFIGGVLFMTVALMSGSIIPSFVMHFVNNVLSVIWAEYYGNTVFCIVFISALVILSLVSTVFIILNRKKYAEAISPLFKINPADEMSCTPLFLIVPMLLLAVFSLFV